MLWDTIYYTKCNNFNLLDRYPGKLVEIFEIPQDKNKFIPLRQEIPLENRLGGKSLFLLHELMVIKNNTTLNSYFDLFKLDEFNSWKYRNIRLIDNSYTSSKILQGYWNNKNLNRLKGIILDLDNNEIKRSSNYYINKKTWKIIKYQGLETLLKKGKIKLISNNPLDENKWVVDIKNRNLQYFSCSGNIIQLDLPKNVNIGYKEINELAFNLSEYPWDYLIPNDISSSKLYLLDLLDKQFNSKLKFYLYDKIKYNCNSYYKTYDELNYYLNNKYITLKDYIYLSHKLDKIMLKHMLPKS